MHLRKKTGSSDDKENECPELPLLEQNKLTKGIGRSPKNQRRRERSDRSSAARRDRLADQLTEPLTREESAADGFLVAQRLFKTKIGNAFHQLRDNDSRRKEEAQNNDPDDDDHRNENEDREERIESQRCPSGGGRTPGNGRSLHIGRHSGSKRTSRAGAEKRKVFQDALTDLRLRLLGNGRESNLDAEVKEKLTHIRSEETLGQPGERVHSDRLCHERLFLSPQFSIGSMGAWLPRHNKARRTSTEGVVGHNRRSPFRIDHFNRGGSGIFGPSAVCSSALRPREDTLEENSSSDTRFTQRGRPRTRRQQRKRNMQMRRSKSSSSLRPQRGSGLHSKLPDDLIELSVEACLLAQIQELRTSLERSERVLHDYLQDSKESQARILDRVDRLTNLYTSLSQSQEIRYKSLLDVFHENYKLLGYVESNFDYVLSVVARGKRTNLQGGFYGLLRFIADYTMAPILGIVRFGSRLYLHLFPRRVANG